MVCLHSSLPQADIKLTRAKFKKFNCPLLKLRQTNQLHKRNNNKPSSDCQQSHSAIIDAVILIAVVGACGVLLYPYINFLVHKIVEFYGAFTYVVKDDIFGAPMVFICLGLSILFAAIALLAITICKGCERPSCRGLKKPAEFDIQLETEDCLKKKSNFSAAKNGVNKKGILKLARDHYLELEAQLKRMAPPNGRATLVCRGRCGCSVGTNTMEVLGPKKTGKFKK